MLYIFCGTDTTLSSKKIGATIRSLEQKKPDAGYFSIEGRELSDDFVNEYALSQGLFEKKYIVKIEYPFENAGSKDLFMNNLDAMADSENVFLILEGKMLADDLKKITKKSEKVFKHEKEKTTDKKFNLFSLVENVARKDKKNSWIIFRDAINRGISSEEIHGLLWWQIKAIYIASITKSVKDSGMKEFSYSKAKKFSQNFTKVELEETMQSLVSVYHEAHLGKIDFETSLEKFLLS